MTFPGLSLAETAARERTWWHTLVARVVSEAGLASRLGGARFDEFFDALFAHFTTADAWAPYPDAGRALERLRDGGVAVGLVTNYDTRVHRVLDAVGLAPLLESVTIPAESGAAKPDPAIFHHALRRQGLQAGEAAHVGDEPGDDYSGAVGAGMLPILLDREDRHRVSGLRRIRSLDEL